MVGVERGVEEEGLGLTLPLGGKVSTAWVDHSMLADGFG